MLSGPLLSSWASGNRFGAVVETNGLAVHWGKANTTLQLRTAGSTDDSCHGHSSKTVGRGSERPQRGCADVYRPPSLCRAHCKSPLTIGPTLDRRLCEPSPCIPPVHGRPSALHLFGSTPFRLQTDLYRRPAEASLRLTYVSDGLCRTIHVFGAEMLESFSVTPRHSRGGRMCHSLHSWNSHGRPAALSACRRSGPHCTRP